MKTACPEPLGVIPHLREALRWAGGHALVVYEMLLGA